MYFSKQQGASKEDVEQLTKYEFRRIGDVDKLKGSSGGIMAECNRDTPSEHVLSEEDAVCFLLSLVNCGFFVTAASIVLITLLTPCLKTIFQ